jgi:hypothetical protein
MAMEKIKIFQEIGVLRGIQFPLLSPRSLHSLHCLHLLK